MNPEISVIVPTYNEERYVEDTLVSVRNQKTRIPYELIVSDCHSTDETRDICEMYADKVVLSDSRTTGSARNTGAKHAGGRYFIFVDADTILPENYLEEAYGIFERDEYVGFCAGFRFRDEKLEYTLCGQLTNFYFWQLSRLRRTVLLGFNVCVPRNIFYKVGGFEDRIFEDAHFSEALSNIGKTRYFTHFHVLTSARRLESMGILGTLKYYLRTGNFGEVYVDVK